MQSFIISHSSCAEQYGDITLNIVIKCNWVTGSPPKFDTLLAVWYRTYMQSFIISHSPCAEQYGNMSSDTHTQGSYGAWKSLSSMEFHLLKIKALKAWNFINQHGKPGIRTLQVHLTHSTDRPAIKQKLITRYFNANTRVRFFDSYIAWFRLTSLLDDIMRFFETTPF